MTVSFNGDVGGVITLMAALLLDIALARLEETSIGVSSVRGELGFFPLGLKGPIDAGWLSCEAISTRGVDVGIMVAVCRDEKVIGL